MPAVSIAHLPFLISQAAAAPGKQPSLLDGMLVPMILMFVVVYYVIIRPQQKRTKEQQSLVSSMKSGDEVVTNGGLHGIISNARDPQSKTVLVKFAENVKIEVDKTAITTVLKTGNAGSTPKASLPAQKTV